MSRPPKSPKALKKSANNPQLDEQTRAAQSGIGADKSHKAVVPPLYLSTTYQWDSIDQKGDYDYGRTVNPTRDLLTNALVDLEGGSGGEMTGSGMSAIDLCLNLLRADDVIIAPHDCYGGTHRLLTHRHNQGRIKVIFIDQSDPVALEQALASRPAMILIETPSNPLMRLVDIEAVTHKARAQKIISVCDNTFLSPVRQKPLALGCDVVVHSCTKFLNGHSDVTAGAVIAADKDVAASLRWWANCTGVTGAPFDAWLSLRGIRTLPARMDVQENNAAKIVTYLSQSPHVDRVHYPGLETHPDFALGKKQQAGPGAIFSFEIKGGFDKTKSFLSQLGVFQLASSLGGVESLICQPALMTHAGMTDDARQSAGIKDNLIRVSVGMEQSDDLISDFEQSFDKLAG